MKPDPFFVDLCPPSDTRLGYRMNRMSGKQSNGRGGGELLLKALGLGKLLSERQSNTNDAEDETRPLVVYDLTAGLARDSLVILTSTFGNNASDLVKLHMIERDPIVASLVSDAMRRLHMLAGSSVDAEDIKVAESERNNARRLVQSLSMEEGDAISVLEKLSSNCGTRDQSVPSDHHLTTVDNLLGDGRRTCLFSFVKRPIVTKTKHR
eukprot:g2457.t1 g2457   contig12:164560-165186(+)